MPAMLPDGRRIGAHLPLGDGMLRAADRAHAIGASAIQIFSDNPTAWRRRPDPPPDLPAFRRRLRAADVGVVAIHASYLINLAGPDALTHDRSVALLAEELRAAPSFGARFVNVHIGSHRGSGIEDGVRRVAEGVAATLRAADLLADRAAPDSGEAADGGPRAMLVLENSAGSGAGLGVDVAELGAIAAALDDLGVAPGRVGFCLDTAHAWGAGVDLRDPSAADGFLAAFGGTIGLDRLVMIHLNDSRAELGSRQDRHEHLAAGRIGGDGLAHLLRHPSLGHVAYLLETPGMDAGYDAINLTRAHDLAAGRAMLDLPADAMDVRSSRSRTA